MRRLILIAGVAALAACTQTPSAGDAPATERAAPTESAAVPVAVPKPDAPAYPPGSPSAELAHWNGYGNTRFGMDEAAFQKAWGGELKNLNEDPACFHLTPMGVKAPADLAFMFVDRAFARYSTESATLSAPGGGKVGDTTESIEKRYSGKIEVQPHKYTDGKYLRIKQGEDILIFATDKAGVVREWRVGRAPAIDYVEGCA